jgi:hypothetical protein
MLWIIAPKEILQIKLPFAIIFLLKSTFAIKNYLVALNKLLKTLPANVDEVNSQPILTIHILFYGICILPQKSTTYIMTHDKWKGLGDWSLRIITWQNLRLPRFCRFNANATKGEESYIFFQVLIILIFGSL